MAGIIQLSLAVFFVSTNICLAQPVVPYSQRITVTTPTSGNFTHQYFNTSSVLNFTYDTIICGTPYCHIICDIDNGCYDLTVDASSSDSLTIECINASSCEYLEIEKGPTNHLDIYCKNRVACKYGNIYVPTTRNVNIFCDYSDTNLGNSVCRNLDFNANNASSVNIVCIGRGSCYYTQFYVTDAEYVTFYGSEYTSTTDTWLYAYNIQQKLDINCKGSYGCADMVIYANTVKGILNLNCSNWLSCDGIELYATDASAVVNINCDINPTAYRPCNGAFFYCPSNGICNINCATDSCPYANFYIPNANYEGLYLDCQSHDACENSEVHCVDNSQISSLIYNFTERSYECVDVNCCPYKSGNFTCSPASDCQIDCLSGLNCMNLFINGGTANSLTVDCRGTSCNGALILCPIGDGTSCSIDCSNGDCKYAVIQTGNDNAMDTFYLNCGGASGCQYLNLDITAASIGDIFIDCSNTYSCRYTGFKIASTVTNEFNLSCASTGCYDVDFIISSTSINSLLLMCDGDCKYSKLLAQNTIVESLFVNCMDCYRSIIEAQIGNSVDMKCVGHAACNQATITLTSISADTNFNIECKNTLVSNSSGQAACFDTEFNIYGYLNANGTSDNVSIECGPFDCYSATFNGYDLFYSIVHCSSQYACFSSIINIPTTYALDLSCTDAYSCQSASVYCSYQNENACKIDCGAQTRTCFEMQIHVAEDYIWNYLDLICPSEEIYATESCTGLNANCDGNNRLQDTYTYNYTIHDWECMNGGVGYCCPYWKGDVITCTVGQECTIDCSTSNCNAAWIDGKDANYLTINCATFDCSRSSINCPKSGCTINCIGSNACYGAEMLYDGTQIDNGEMHINCTGYRSCYDVMVDAETVAQIDILCDGSASCGVMKFYAKYANRVVVDLISSQASLYTSWYVDHSASVVVTAKGSLSFYDSALYAGNAGSLVLSLFSNAGSYSATVDMWWYIPINVTIKCHGTGCYDLNYIQRPLAKNASGFDLYILSCGQCWNIGECLGSFQLSCKGGSDTYDAMEGCDSVDNCGCLDILNDSYIPPFIDQECYTQYTTAQPTMTPTTSTPTTVEPTEEPINAQTTHKSDETTSKLSVITKFVTKWDVNTDGAMSFIFMYPIFNFVTILLST